MRMIECRKRTFPIETVTRVGRWVRRLLVGRVVGAKAATDATRRKKTLNGDIARSSREFLVLLFDVAS